MDIYSDEGTEGILDIWKAKHELAKTGAMNVEVRRAAVAEISAAALLDIAYSLRPIGAEAAAAMTPYMAAAAEDSRREPDAIDFASNAEDFFVVGDIVAVNGHAESAEILGFGVDQGEHYARVVFESGVDVKIWLTNLTRIVGAEEAEAADAAAESTIETLRELNAEADGEPDLPITEDTPADVTLPDGSKPDVDEDGLPILYADDGADVEDDFDVAPDIDPEFEVDPLAGAATALDTLKASQAARKPAKKKGGKK